jgi:hypothetical protein
MTTREEPGRENGLYKLREAGSLAGEAPKHVYIWMILSLVDEL